MSEMDFKTFINGVGNDFKIAIDDVIGAILNIQEDVEKLKIKTSKPDKKTAQALLEYFAMEEGRVKQNMEILCGEEINEYLKWVDEYCKEYCCSQEEALKFIIEEKL
jgi:hypothetical protein